MTSVPFGVAILMICGMATARAATNTATSTNGHFGRGPRFAVGAVGTDTTTPGSVASISANGSPPGATFDSVGKPSSGIACNGIAIAAVAPSSICRRASATAAADSGRRVGSFSQQLVDQPGERFRHGRVQLGRPAAAAR